MTMVMKVMMVMVIGEFDQLNKDIEKLFPTHTFSKLPKKHFLGNLKKDVVSSRQV